MIRHPAAVVAALAGIEALVLWVSSRPRCKKYFSFLPPVFWIYSLPMLLASAGMLDASSRIYPLITTYILPASLVLLLLSSDICRIMELGKSALAMMLAGSLGIMLGTVSMFSLVKGRLDPQAWAGFGALSASWTGGSANMIAVKEALATPERVFTPMVIVDTVVPYVWMGILIAMAGLQPMFDRWNRADGGILERLGCKVNVPISEKGKIAGARYWIALVAVSGAALAVWVSGFLPEIPDMLSRYAWMIICVSCIGIALSFTRLRRLGEQGATDAGYYLLYFVLTSIGAKASIQNAGSALLLIGAGFGIVLVHALVLFFTARLMRAPLFLVATASQANIGGVASAPVVAAMYRPALASVGLLLAILGNIIGTYLGIITGRICAFLR